VSAFPNSNRALRRGCFQRLKSLPQPMRIKLIDGEHPDAALRATWTTNKPFAASTRRIGQRRINDLD
jgi:hypothetical protein